jgi:hypothetical protein
MTDELTGWHVLLVHITLAVFVLLVLRHCQLPGSENTEGNTQPAHHSVGLSAALSAISGGNWTLPNPASPSQDDDDDDDDDDD